MLGTTLRGRFKILNQLGSGAFGQTYLAEDEHHLKRPQYVVKRFKPQVRHPEVLRKAQDLFEREAEVLDQLGHHDRIPRLIAYFEEEINGNQEFFLVQEFVEGKDLTHELIPGQLMSEARVVSLLKDVLEILEFVHQQNAIHRDIKPSNLIRRQRDGKIALIDFGAVKQVTGLEDSDEPEPPSSPHPTVIGTRGYMPPEQFAGHPKRRSDLYALGIVGIQALTGELPETMPRDSRTGQVIWRDRTSVTPELANILDKMACEDCDRRYKNTAAILQDLQRLEDSDHLELEQSIPISAAVTQLPVEPTPSKNRSTFRSMPPVKWQIMGVGALILAVVGGFWYSQVASGSNCLGQDVPMGLFSYGGSTTWAPIRDKVDSKLQERCPPFRLRYTHPTVGDPGSGTGIQQLLRGQIDFAQSSRPLVSSEIQDAQGFKLREIAVAIDGIAIAVHPDLNIPGLTVTQLRDIYTGAITNWSQVGGPDLPITPYSRRVEAGGTVEFFVESVLVGQRLGDTIVYVPNTTAGLQAVSSNLGGIYYASAPEVVGQCTVRPLPIGHQPDLLVAPYQEPYVPVSDCPNERNQLNLNNLQSGNYPITRKLFVIVKENGQIEENAGEAYTNLLLTPQGQELIEQAGFVRIR
ncbi:MAG: protein kinase [Cyanobacteria bacterium CRU_2_1]|nr:protein kinase [Cyanobacteria bacterium RU_5_0]NJR60701.1 protein kinase [Cyanobacteria bacterium CRU_2_1]